MPRRSLVSAPAPGTSLQTRIVRQSLLLTAFIVVVLTTLSFWVARSLMEQAVRHQLSSLAMTTTDTVESVMRGYRERTSYVAQSTDVLNALRRGNATSAADALFHALRQEEATVIGLMLLGAQGEVLATAGVMEGERWEGWDRAHLRPRVTQRGWDASDVLVPIQRAQQPIGALVVRYDMHATLASLLQVVPPLGSTARLLFLVPESHRTHLLFPAIVPDDAYVLTLEDGARAFSQMIGTAGVRRQENECGRDTLAASRILPSLGWGVRLEVERYDALSGVRHLALAHASIGTLLLLLAGVFALALARQVTEPLRALTATARRLGPGQWTVARTAHTDDEVGVLERVFVDLAARLRRLYDHLEEEITARTRELRKQYALDRAIRNHIAYGIVTADRDGCINGVNPAALSLLGIASEQETIGRPVAEVVPLCDEHGVPWTRPHPIVASLRKRAVIHSRVGARDTVRTRNGSLLPVITVASPLIEGRRLFGALMVFQDVSEERRLEERKSEFVTLASHQLRTPLSTMHWYMELLAERNEQLSGEQRSYLIEMRKASDRMLALLTTLLHAAQYEGEGVQPSLKRVDLSALARQAYADCQSLAREAHVQCNLVIPTRRILVQSDPIHVHVLLQNILSNAVKYASYAAGEKTVTFTIARRARTVVLRIADTGIGIPQADQPRIFERFFRAENARKADTDGNGLGLSICKAIVERLGGTIRFTSKENEGTVFTVTLPRESERKTRDEGRGTKD